MLNLHNPKTITFCLLAICIAFTSCEDNNTVDNTPDQYEFLRAEQSTVSYSGQTTRLLMATELINSMKDVDVTVDLLNEQLNNAGVNGEDVAPYENDALNSETKSVKSKIAASKDFFFTNTTESSTIKNDFDIWMDQTVNETYVNKEVLASAGVAGQIEDGDDVRYISAKGIEYNQIASKSLIGSLLTDQILNNYLSPAVLDEGTNRADNDAGITAEGKPYTTMEHKWDEAYGYLFGMSADGSDPLTTLGEDDDFLNKYLGRVDTDEDFAGIAKEVYEAFINGRAAIVAGEYDIRDKNADIIKDAISKVIAIRAVYYMQDGKNTLENNKGGAFHSLSEGIGFIYSLRFTRKTGSEESYFTRSEVDDMVIQLLGDGDTGLWDIDPQVLDTVSEQIAARFDFTVQEAK